MNFFKNRKADDRDVLMKQEQENILNKDTNFFIHEAYNALRSNITFSLTEKGCKIISVTSTEPSEGKSINALNIAVSYAEIDKRVLIVDCDLRRPKLHRLVEKRSSPGLSNVLVGECEIGKAVNRLEDLKIDAIFSGDIPPNSTQLLESEAMKDFFEKVKDDYDYIIIDTPPINTVIDACILAKYMSGIIFVIKQDYAKKESIVNAVNQIEFAGGRIIGFILNNITDKSSMNLFGTYKYKKYRYGKYKYSYYRSSRGNK